MRTNKLAKHILRYVGCLLLCFLFNSAPVNAGSSSENPIYKAMLAKVDMLVEKLDWDNLSVKDKRKFFKKFKDVTEGIIEVNVAIANKSNVKIFSDKLLSDVTEFANKNIEEIDFSYLKSTFSSLFTAAFFSVSRIVEDNPRVLSMIANFQDNRSVAVIYDLMNS